MLIGLPGLESKYSDPDTQEVGVVNPRAAREELVEKDGGMNLALKVLGVYELSSESSLRIQASYDKESLDLVGSQKVDSGVTGDGDYNDQNEQVKSSRSYSKNAMGVRAALNKVVNDDELVVLAVGLDREASTREKSTENTTNDRNADLIYDFEKDDMIDAKVEESLLTIPVIIAVEGTMRDNISLRMGAKKNVFTLWKKTDTDLEYDYYAQEPSLIPAYQVSKTTVTEYSMKKRASGDDLTMTLGAGVEFNNFTINADIAQDILINGPFFLNGQPNTFAGAIDVIYSF
jgi:hypothetical protein